MRPGKTVKVLSQQDAPLGVVLRRHSDETEDCPAAWRVLCQGKVVIVFEDELEVIK